MFHDSPGVLSSSGLRTISQQMLKVVSVLHGLDLIQGDAEPSYLRARSDCVEIADGVICVDSGVFHVKLADCGSCMIADPQRRPQIRRDKLREELRLITVMPDSAPEILFGDTGFGTAIDLWSMGITMLHFLGVTSTFTEYTEAASNEVALVSVLCFQLGITSKEELASLERLPFPRWLRAFFPRQL